MKNIRRISRHYKAINKGFGAWLALGLLLSLLLSACNSSGTQTAPTGNPVTSQPATTTGQPITASATSTTGTATTATSAASTTGAATNRPATTSSPGTTSSAVTTAPNTAVASTATSAPAVSPTATQPIVAAPTPTVPAGLKAADQILNITAGSLSTFDPALIDDVNNAFINRQIFSGLVTLDKDLKVVPDMAVRLPDISENGTLYTFYLRKGIKFHSGREVTADDIKYSWERATDPKLADPDPASTLPAANYMSDIVGVKERLDGKSATISGVTVKDKYTLQVKTDGPKPYFLAKMTYNCFFVVNKDVVSKGFDQQQDGTGPFKLAEYKKDQLIRLERNPDFYNGVARLNQVNILQGAAANGSLTLYEQNKIDFTFVGASVEAERVLDKNNPLNKELVIKPQLDVTYVAFNNRAKPFDDPKIRQAFSLVIDRAKIARVMFESKVLKADTILPPGMPGYSGNPGTLTYDVNRARDLIAQSSYRKPDSLPKITLYTTGDGLGRVLQEVYKQAFGIEIEVRQYDFKDFQSGLSAGQFQLYTYGWVADYPDPENFLRALLGTGSPYNESGYSNPQFDEMLRQADAQTDAQRRLQMYAEAEQIALNDAAILPVYHAINYLLVKPYVKGLDLTNSGILSLKDVYIVK